MHVAIVFGMACTIISALSNYPHQLAYFNHFTGRPTNGHFPLLHSSFDWGQDQLFLAEQIESIAGCFDVIIWVRDPAMPECSVWQLFTVDTVTTPRAFQEATQVAEGCNILFVFDIASCGHARYKRDITDLFDQYRITRDSIEIRGSTALYRLFLVSDSRSPLKAEEAGLPLNY